MRLLQRTGKYHHLHCVFTESDDSYSLIAVIKSVNNLSRFASMTGKASAAEGNRQRVTITSGETTWHYLAQVKSGEWLLPMPFFLIDEWQAGKLTVAAL